MPERGPGALLDEIGAAVFGGAAGRARIDPALACFDETVGRELDDDVHRETLLAVRLDWALCEAPVEGVDRDHLVKGLIGRGHKRALALTSEEALPDLPETFLPGHCLDRIARGECLTIQITSNR